MTDSGNSAIDWTVWRPIDLATLVFVIRKGEMLLIRKKRGLGAGKINGPGGRLEQGECPEDCAVRELQEELLITPEGLVRKGILEFQFVDGYSLRVFVFACNRFQGTPTETDEALPIWTSTDEIPYHEMWADDELWFPKLLDDQTFIGSFLFDGDRMVTCDLRDLSVDGLHHDRHLETKEKGPH